LGVKLGFSQAEGALPVQATIELRRAGVLVEPPKQTTTLASTLLDTRMDNGATFEVRARIRDSNDLTSSDAVASFSVAYASPPPPLVAATYQNQFGQTQLDLDFPAPVSGQVAAINFTVTRQIGGQPETILEMMPVAGPVTIIDTTPTINGINRYQISAWSIDDTSAVTTIDVETTETNWAFLSTGAGWQNMIRFYGNLSFGFTMERDQNIFDAAGRAIPIGMFGENRHLSVSGAATIVAGKGSTPQQIETFLRDATQVCYRDPSGRRMFGVIKGQVTDWRGRLASFAYTVTEAQ